MYGRKAYGAHRPMSADVKAKNVALSIIKHNLPLTRETWERYGLHGTAKLAQRRIVLQYLNKS